MGGRTARAILGPMIKICPSPYGMATLEAPENVAVAS